MFAKFFKKLSQKNLIVQSDEARQEYALSCFNKAIALLYQKKFRRAEHQMGSYKEHIDYNSFYKKDRRRENNPVLSIVIVAYKTQNALIDCIESILSQIDPRSELIVVDNGGNEPVQKKLLELNLLYIKNPQNLILSEGRNIGVSFARGDILVFIDDDALVAQNYLDSIFTAFDTQDIFALRGKVLPKTHRRDIVKISHYNLGKKPINAIINTEGNSAVLKKIYNDFNGMNPLLFGHEGMELSFRIYKEYGIEKIIYWPDTVIYHDYANTNIKFEEKNKRSTIMDLYLLKRNRGMKKYKKLMKQIILEQASPVADS
jgi:glycosyltransferase involved in cell wall biosynthesis